MNRRDLCHLAAAAIALCSVWTPGHAQDRGTPDDAKALVAKGLEHIKKVGVEAAFKDFNNDKDNWVKKDVYLFALDMKGHQVVHGVNPKMVGKDVWDVKDANGKLFFQEFSATAGKGGGWVDYTWAHPQTKKLEAKASYVMKIPNTDYYLGAGAYK